MVAAIANFFMDRLDSASYLGIYVLMTIESSFIPFPSEIVMIPAGYLVYQGDMQGSAAFVAGTAGSLTGALINYFIGYFGGRKFLLKYGKYFFLKPKTLELVDYFFLKYGDVATFSSRLIFGIRQLVSVPAGVARMHLGKFCFYTTAGAGLWVTCLLWVGYFLASQQSEWSLLWKQNKALVIIGGLGAAVVLGAIVIYTKKVVEKVATSK